LKLAILEPAPIRRQPRGINFVDVFALLAMVCQYRWITVMAAVIA